MVLDMVLVGVKYYGLVPAIFVHRTLQQQKICIWKNIKINGQHIFGTIYVVMLSQYFGDALEKIKTVRFLM